MAGLSIIDGVLVAGMFAVALLLTLFIRDDNEVPDVPYHESGTNVPESKDDDLDLSWSVGTGDWR